MSETRSDHSTLRTKIADGIREGDWQRLAEELGFETEDAVEIPSSTYDVWGISRESASAFDAFHLLSSEPGFRLLLVQGEADYRAFRGLVTGLSRRNVEDAALWWWDRGDTAIAATATRRADGRMRVRTIEISRQSPEAAALEAWVKLERARAVRVDRADGGAAMRRHLAEAFEHREITRSFFRGFSSALSRLIETLEEGPEAQRECHELCLAALLRMVFVYFLQRRGMLGSDSAFVLRHLRRACSEDRNFSEAVLKPLFFGALNRPVGQRDSFATRLGTLPFLNGGLFEPLPVEEAHSEYSWPNAVWTEIIEGLFERYHFAVSETQVDDDRAAVDPEMLGRVFEGLMYGSSRQKSGSFYTPRDVVRSMVESALSGHLVDCAELEPEAATEVVRGEGGQLSSGERERVQSALEEVAILDPAVGTGAFLLEALHALRRCWRAVGTPDPGDEMERYRHVRSLIHRHLFGVDIQHTAVRLCELRLWLALLETMPDLPNEQVPPLPNLAHRVCTGNSLLSPLDLVQLEAGASKSDERTWGLGESREISRGYLERTKALQDRWLTSHGADKRRVRSELEASFREMQMALLDSRRRKLAEKLEPFLKLARSENLFGEEVELAAGQRAEFEALTDQLAALEQARDDIEAGRASGLAFSYAARFAAVLERGGFDIIVTNPPWVRANRIDESLKGLLKRRYRSHSNALWLGAEDLGIRAPFGAQTDLAALFLERSLELLAAGGHLCALVPAKLFRSLHGAALRRHLMEHDLLRIEDHSDSEREMFDATVYPAVIHARKVEAGAAGERRKRRTTARRRPRRPGVPRGSVTVTTWRRDRAACWSAPKRSLSAVEGAPGAPWLLLEGGVARVIDEMRANSVPMGTVSSLQPRRGFFTGCNERFLTDAERARELLGDDWREWTREVARGRDCRGWEVDAAGRILWGYDPDGEPRSEVPRAFSEYFERHREQLEGRSDYRSSAPLWQVFRVKPGLIRPKVLWRDLSQKLEAAYVGPEVVPLNTVYFVPFESEPHARVFEALLNSEPVRAVAYALGERARGGWRRHFSWVMRMLPVPKCVRRVVSGAAGVDTIVARDELALLETGATDEKQTLADRLGARWFGLGNDDLARLTGWRRGDCGQADMEVAA